MNPKDLRTLGASVLFLASLVWLAGTIVLFSVRLLQAINYDPHFPSVEPIDLSSAGSYALALLFGLVASAYSRTLLFRLNVRGASAHATLADMQELKELVAKLEGMIREMKSDGAGPPEGASVKDAPKQ